MMKTLVSGEERTGDRAYEHGFTLIEMLVALAILGLSLTVLFSVFSRALAREQHDAHEAAARTLAQTLLAETTARAPLAPSQHTGTMASGFAWSVAVSPYASSTANDVLKAARVAVAVAWDEGGTPHEVRLDTLSTLAPTK